VTLQSTEIEVVALLQLLRLEQVRNDHHIDRAPGKGGEARRRQRARQAAYGANHSFRNAGKSAA
jgi:hypothetical protein